MVHNNTRNDKERSLEKFSGNPLISAGLFATMIMLGGGIRSLSKGDNLSNYMFGRAVAQTITAGLLFYTFADKDKMIARARATKDEIFKIGHHH
eukprot:CAMPEP_0201521756 /NCGR_PEP_ID=MMETSP0161_2-20130828/16057_1 /ASSEMBLY_ACC=CAM_ASM_000251 /TAXON_ID=180227 /ORGANISM="Neoparamoeba aestuarina, Strain SoJaBio B1-5/56/2" /LENGTH=93 /DNA_ID=CAMNT_0047920457 /DNA_START=70 /DNA_END=351 /DNA_ORIENTATION=+